MKHIYLFLILILLVGCGTTKTYDCRYEEVAKVLKDKFVVTHDEFLTSKPVVYEKGDVLEISFGSNFDYYFSLGIDISLKSKNAKVTIVKVKVMEYYKAWSYESRSKKMEKQFLDILGKRLETGKWEKLPWEKKKEVNTDIIPAILEDIQERH